MLWVFCILTRQPFQPLLYVANFTNYPRSVKIFKFSSMKKLATAILILSAVQAFSQTGSSEALRTQVNKLNNTIATLKGENKVIKDSLASIISQNQYFRETLKIYESKSQTASANDLDVSLISCKAQTGNNTVVLEFLVTNRGTEKTILFTPTKFGTAVDLQGNGYRPSDIKIGAAKYSSTVYKDVPLKLTITISRIDPAVKLLKLVNIEFSTPQDSYKKASLVFKDISIQ